MNEGKMERDGDEKMDERCGLICMIPRGMVYSVQ